MRVGVVAWAGSDNLGDELLVHSLIHCVRAVRADATFTVFAPDPDRVSHLHTVDACPMPTLRARGAARRQALVHRAIRDCDLLVLGPGTVFQERSPTLAWPGTLALFARIVGMARAAGTPVAPVGVGVREGGTRLGRAVLRGIGAASLAVGTRDGRSAAYFGARARAVGDLAYALQLPDRAAPASTGARLAVSLRPLPAPVEGPLLASVGTVLRRLGDEGWAAAFLPMAYGRGARGEDDRTVYRRMPGAPADLVPNPLDSGLPLGAHLDGWLRDLAGYRLVLGTRLHAALLAVALGVPTVAIAYERKVRDAFTDLGLGRFLLDPTVDAGTLYRTATAAVAEPATFAAAAAQVAAQAAVARRFVAALLERVG